MHARDSVGSVRFGLGSASGSVLGSIPSAPNMLPDTLRHAHALHRTRPARCAHGSSEDAVRNTMERDTTR
eukprot:4793092-Prymnesium_polylepis.1